MMNGSGITLADLLMSQREGGDPGATLADLLGNRGGMTAGGMPPGAMPPGWNMLAGPPVPMRGLERLNPQPRIDRDQGWVPAGQPAPGTQSAGPGVGGSDWRNETPRNYDRLLGILRGQGLSDAAARAQAREMLRMKGLLPPGEQAPAR